MTEKSDRRRVTDSYRGFRRGGKSGRGTLLSVHDVSSVPGLKDLVETVPGASSYFRSYLTATRFDNTDSEGNFVMHGSLPEDDVFVIDHIIDEHFVEFAERTCLGPSETKVVVLLNVSSEDFPWDYKGDMQFVNIENDEATTLNDKLWDFVVKPKKTSKEARVEKLLRDCDFLSPYYTGENEVNICARLGLQFVPSPDACDFANDKYLFYLLCKTSMDKQGKPNIKTTNSAYFFKNPTVIDVYRRWCRRLKRFDVLDLVEADYKSNPLFENGTIEDFKIKLDNVFNPSNSVALSTSVETVLLKGNVGASGSSLVKVRRSNLYLDDGRVNEEYIIDLFTEVSNVNCDGFIVEPYLDIVSSPSSLWMIDESLIPEKKRLSDQVLGKHSREDGKETHEGNQFPTWFKERYTGTPLENQLEEVAGNIVRRLIDLSYTGHVGIDLMVDKDGVVYPAEINARITGATYPWEIVEILNHRLPGKQEIEAALSINVQGLGLAKKHPDYNGGEGKLHFGHLYNALGSMMYDGTNHDDCIIFFNEGALTEYGKTTALITGSSKVDVHRKYDLMLDLLRKRHLEKDSGSLKRHNVEKVA